MFFRNWQRVRLLSLNDAMGLHRAGDISGARDAYRAMLAADPEDINAIYLLGTTEMQLGELDAAIAHLSAAADRMPGFAPVQLNLGLAMRAAGQLQDAMAAFERAAKTQPDHANAWSNVGATAFALGDMRRAREAFVHAVALPNASDDAFVNLGTTELKLGEQLRAVTALRRAIDINPLNVDALLQLSSALSNMNDSADAEGLLARAETIDPGNARALFQRGQFAERTRKAEEAITNYRAAIQRNPNLAEAEYALGCLLWEEGDGDSAKACFDRALNINPELADARWARVMAEVSIVRADRAVDAVALASLEQGLSELDAWFSGRRADEGWASVGTIQPYFIVYYDSNHRDALSRYGDLCHRLMGRWQEQHRPQEQHRSHAPTVVKCRSRVRVGVVAAHLRKHSIWDAIVRGWFTALDPAKVELVSYHIGEVEGAETSLARDRSLRYVHHSGPQRKRLETWVDEIRDDAPDVLLYPEIGLDGLSLQLASMRLAPIQATTWGQPETSGLPTLDYFLSGESFEPPDADANYRERLVRLPNLGVWYEPLVVVPEVPDWDALGLDPMRPILLCPGTPFKYAPRADVAMVEIVRRVADVQLVFFNYERAGLTRTLNDRLLRAFATAGVAQRDALRFIPWQRIDRYYGLMSHATAMLDTIGFSGFNTAIQALECGLPVMAWEGQFLRGRLASGLMRRMEMPELVAHTTSDYAAGVARLCLDDEFCKTARNRIAARRSRLFCDEEPIRAMESLFTRLAQGTAHGP